MTRKKLLLLHGWDWHKYPKFAPPHQWTNRQQLLDLLRQNYEITFPSLPGFALADLNRGGSWTLRDYAAWLDREVSSGAYDAIVGYSFGCAVITCWLSQQVRRSTPAILISPAIARAYSRKAHPISRSIARLLRHFGPLSRAVRTLYLRYWIRNPFVIHGSPFLVATYSNIVGADLSQDFADVLQRDHRILCIFGADDTATPPEKLFSKVPAARAVSLVITGASHNVGGTHSSAVASEIQRFLA